MTTTLYMLSGFFTVRTISKQNKTKQNKKPIKNSGIENWHNMRILKDRNYTNKQVFHMESERKNEIN